MSDTPETDAAWKEGNAIREWTCRKLERERDEAREDADHWKIEYEIVVSRLCGVKHDRDNGVIFEHEIIPKLQRERDEALEKLSAAWQSLRDSQDEVLRLTFENRELRNLSNE
jgi:hypothetical protein